MLHDLGKPIERNIIGKSILICAMWLVGYEFIRLAANT